MKLNINAISIIWMVSSFVVLFNAWASFSRSKVRGSRAFALFNVAVAWYAFFAAFELMSSGIDWILFFSHIEYLAICPTPLLMLWFTFEFLDFDPSYKKPLFIGLGVFGAIVLLLQWTTLRHGLMYQHPTAEAFGSLQVLHFKKGIVYILWVIVLGVCIGSAALLFLRALGKAEGILKRQLQLVAAAFCIPLIVFLLYVMSVIPLPYDLTPFSFTVVSIMTTYALFGTDMFAFAPVSREKVFMSMEESCVIADEHGLIVDMNQRTNKILPILNSTAIGRPATEVFSMFPLLVDALNHREENIIEFDARTVGGPERVMVKISPIQSKSNKNTGYMIVFEDITKLNHMIDELKRYATLDDLTGLSNRRHFFEAIRPEVEKSISEGSSVGVIMLDIDDFKSVNDVYGHALGDELLQSCARTMADTIRSEDIIGRFGGDEFVVFMPKADIEITKIAAERLRQAVASMQIPQSFDKPLHISLGIAAAIVANFEEVEGLLSRADTSMYKAKRNGGNQISL